MFLYKARYYYDKDTEKYVLSDELRFLSKTYGLIAVPPGFESDGASTPWGVRNTLPQQGASTYPAFLHDYLYAIGGRYSDTRVFSRKDCDRIYTEGLEDQGMGAIRRSLSYRGLRLAFWQDSRFK